MIRRLLKESIRKRLMAERRIGCLLSGGLDSSLITALLVKLAKEHNLPYKIQVINKPFLRIVHFTQLNKYS